MTNYGKAEQQSSFTFLIYTLYALFFLLCKLNNIYKNSKCITLFWKTFFNKEYIILVNETDLLSMHQLSNGNETE